MFPKLADGSIRAAGMEKNRDSSNLAVAGFVHQVSHHIEGLTLNGLFTGMVKVELRQFIALVSYKQKIPVSRSVVHSERRVTIVNDFERAAFVFESYGGEPGFPRISNVDGRLFLADLAGSVVRIQVTPMFGPAC